MNQFFQLLFDRIPKDRAFLYRMGVIFGFLLLVTLILPRTFIHEYEYEVGKKWEDPDLVSPMNFAVFQTEEEMETVRREAIEQILPIYRLDTLRPTSATNNLKRRLAGFYQTLRSYHLAGYQRDTLKAGIQRRNLSTLYGVRVGSFPPDTTKQIPRWVTQLEQQALGIIDSVYRKGLIFADRDTFRHDFITLRYMPARARTVALNSLFFPESASDFVSKSLSSLPNPHQVLLNGLLTIELKPNYLFAPDLQEEEVQRMERLIVSTEGVVKANEIVIRRGQIVGPAQDRKLQSLEAAQQQSFGDQNRWGLFFSQFLVVALITAVLILYLVIDQSRIYLDSKRLGLILLTLFLVVGAMVLALKLQSLLGTRRDISVIYLAPACLVPIIIMSFFESRTAFICNLLVALYGAVLVQRGMEFAFVQILAGTVTLYSLRRMRDRRTFFFALGYMLASYLIAHTIFSIFSKGSLYEFQFGNLLVFVFNLSLTILAYPLIYIFEKIFQITSDLTFLELLDTNHPLLQKLAREAPGSFQHSMQVANIAESVVAEVGGNPLLVRVGALYHDIGKCENPSFFIENLSNEESPHNKISCQESARIIINHVKEGVLLAQKYKMPREIIDAIQTHHGTTRVEYFYRQHLKEKGCDPPEDENLFRYPGPKPFSRETAILMISDSIEAASRSLKNPTDESLARLTNGIIDGKIADGQLANTPLTFRDLTQVRSVILKKLISINHGRIEYPE